MIPGVSTCDHCWQRWPIVTSSVIYQCQECETALQFSWLAASGGTLDDLDRAFEAKRGGTVIGPHPATRTVPDHQLWPRDWLPILDAEAED